MTAPSSADNSRDSDLPFLWHEAEFDVAADLGYKDAVPTGEFTRCEHIHLLSEFDCSQRVEEGGEVALRLTFHLQAGESPPPLARDVSELLYALHEYDKALGGQGLGLDRTASRAGGGRLSLVLRPNDFIISLQPKPGDSPAGLEEEIASLIRSACPREERHTESDDDTWAPTDETTASPETVVVEARLFHAIDQIAAEEHKRASAPPLAARAVNELAETADAAPSRSGDLEERIRRALQRCRRHNLHLSAEAIDVSRHATTQHSSERVREE